MSKSRDAFRTISEVSDVLDTPAHVLRFWESKFTQVKPVKRAGGRRYYRPADVDLLAGIKKLLHVDGMTIKGAQKLMREQGVKHVTAIGAEIMGSLKEQSGPEDVAEQIDAPAAAPEASPADPAPETVAPAPEPEVAITNVVPMPAPTVPASNGPALSLNLGQSPTPPEPAQTPVPAAPAEDTAPKVAMPDLPADPSDSDSKAPARLFHLLRTTQPDALHARAAEIAPLLARMRTLRSRINLR